MRAEAKPQQTSDCHGDRRGGECSGKAAGRISASPAPSLEARKSGDRAHAKCLREEDRARLEASDLNSQVLGSLRRVLQPLEVGGKSQYPELSAAVFKMLERVPEFAQACSGNGTEEVAAPFLTTTLQLPLNMEDTRALQSCLNKPVQISTEVLQHLADALTKASALQKSDTGFQDQLSALKDTVLREAASHPPPLPALPVQKEVPGAEIGGQKTWEEERDELRGSIDLLQAHKTWADAKIVQLIKRVKEETVRSEALNLKDEVQQLRLEKDRVEGRLKEFESSLQKLKECTYEEGNKRRQCKRQLNEAEAQLRGSALREQELQAQVAELQTSLKQERKRREGAERLAKKAASDKAEAEAQATEAAGRAEDMRAQLAQAEAVAREQAGRMQAAEDLLLEARHHADVKAKQVGIEKEVAEVKCGEAESLVASLRADLGRAAAKSEACAEEIERLTMQVAVLTAHLAEAQQAVAERAQQSYYNQWEGRSIFGGGFATPPPSPYRGLTASPERFGIDLGPHLLQSAGGYSAASTAGSSSGGHEEDLKHRLESLHANGELQIS